MLQEKCYWRMWSCDWRPLITCNCPSSSNKAYVLTFLRDYQTFRCTWFTCLKSRIVEVLHILYTQISSWMSRSTCIVVESFVRVVAQVIVSTGLWLVPGAIGKLRISIPWKKLGWEPILIFLEDVTVSVAACEDIDNTNVWFISLFISVFAFEHFLPHFLQHTAFKQWDWSCTWTLKA